MESSYSLTISSMLQELLRHRFLTLVQNYHFHTVFTRLTFSIGRYGNVALFLLRRPLNFTISSEFFDISMSCQLPFTIKKVVSPTDATN